jgi:hypothetical protein
MGKWVKFVNHFMWHVPEYKGRVTIAYKPGRRFVKDDCAEQAIAKGRAVPCESPRAAAIPSEGNTESLGGFVKPSENPYLVGEKPSEFTVKKPVYASGSGSSEGGSN